MPRRRRKSEIEDLIDIASILPWWLGLSIAVLSYVLLHPLAETPVPTATSPGDIAGPITAQVIRTGAMIGQYFLPIIFVFGAGASALKAYRNKKLLTEAKETTGSADLMDLSWEDFEHLVGEAFREHGFSVSETAPGPDGGVDLEVRKDGELHLVQCKRWRARKVGVEIVRELYRCHVGSRGRWRIHRDIRNLQPGGPQFRRWPQHRAVGWDQAQGGHPTGS